MRSNAAIGSDKSYSLLTWIGIIRGDGKVGMVIDLNEGRINMHKGTGQRIREERDSRMGLLEGRSLFGGSVPG